MPETLTNFRRSFPQYNDLPDGKIVSALRQKYPVYSDIPDSTFVSALERKYGSVAPVMQGTPDTLETAPVSDSMRGMVAAPDTTGITGETYPLRGIQQPAILQPQPMRGPVEVELPEKKPPKASAKNLFWSLVKGFEQEGGSILHFAQKAGGKLHPVPPKEVEKLKIEYGVEKPKEESILEKGAKEAYRAADVASTMTYQGEDKASKIASQVASGIGAAPGMISKVALAQSVAGPYGLAMLGGAEGVVGAEETGGNKYLGALKGAAMGEAMQVGLGAARMLPGKGLLGTAGRKLAGGVIFGTSAFLEELRKPSNERDFSTAVGDAITGIVLTKGREGGIGFNKFLEESFEFRPGSRLSPQEQKLQDGILEKVKSKNPVLYGDLMAMPWDRRAGAVRKIWTRTVENLSRNRSFMADLENEFARKQQPVGYRSPASLEEMQGIGREVEEYQARRQAEEPKEKEVANVGQEGEGRLPGGALPRGGQGEADQQGGIQGEGRIHPPGHPGEQAQEAVSPVARAQRVLEAARTGRFREKAVDDFVRRLVSGEEITSPVDVRFYEDNADAIEAGLQKELARLQAEPSRAAREMGPAAGQIIPPETPVARLQPKGEGMTPPSSRRPGIKVTGTVRSQTYASLVRSMGGIRATQDIRGEYRESIPLFAKNRNGTPLDEMVLKLQERGYNVKDANDLLNKIRDRVPVDTEENVIPVEKQMEETKASEIEEFNRFQPEEVVAGSLEQGERFKIKGEDYQVKSKKPGEIIVEDGERFVLDEFDKVPVDRGEIESARAPTPPPAQEQVSKVDLKKRHEQLAMKAETAGDEEVADLLRRVWRTYANLPETDAPSFRNWKTSLDNLEDKLHERFPLVGEPTTIKQPGAAREQYVSKELLGQARMPEEKISRGEKNITDQEVLDHLKERLNTQIKEFNQLRRTKEAGVATEKTSKRIDEIQKEIKNTKAKIQIVSTQENLFEKKTEEEPDLFRETPSRGTTMADAGGYVSTPAGYAKQQAKAASDAAVEALSMVSIPEGTKDLKIKYREYEKFVSLRQFRGLAGNVHFDLRREYEKKIKDAIDKWWEQGYKDNADIEKVQISEIEMQNIRPENAPEIPRQAKVAEKKYSYKSLADVGGYAKSEMAIPRKPMRLAMPEIVQMAKNLLGEKFPRIFKELSKRSAIGLFRAQGKGAIELKAEIFKGEVLKEIVGRASPEQAGKIIDKLGIPAERVQVSTEWDKSRKAWVTKFYQIDPTLAGKVLSHEIGHLVDYLPEKTMARGNILGRIASLKKYMKSMLEAYPGAPGKPLEQADRDRLQKLARKLARKFAEVEVDEQIRKETPVTPEDILKIWNTFAAREKDPDLYKFIANLDAAAKKSIVLEAMKGKVSDLITFKRLITVETRKVKKTVEIKGPEWEEAVRNKYFELIRDEVRKRQLFERDVIMQELKDLTQIWKPFDPQENPAFTKYRHSSTELYADAFSVLINDPVQLEKTAPQFNKAFFNYMGNKPEMAKVYAELQRQTGMSEAELYKLRHGNVQQMFKRSAEKRLAMEKKEEPGILHDILVKFADENYPLIEKVAKTKGVKPEDNPQYWKEELPYVQSAAFQYMRDIDNYVLKPLKESKITEGDLGEFLMLRRSATERKYLANPLGYNVLESKRQAKQMLLDLGSERAKVILRAVHYYDRIRKHHITSFLWKSGMLSDELMGYIENNENYATFNVSKYMEDKYGDNALTASIKRQLGTLSEIENPLYATVAKDAVMVRAASRKLAAEKFVEFMQEHYPGEIRESRKTYDANLGGMKVRESAERGKKTVLFMDKGKMTGYDVDEKLAELFERDPRQFGGVLKLVNTLTSPFKDIFVGKNPFWSLWNIQRDIRGTLTKLPNEVSITGFFKNLAKTIPDAYQDVFKNASTDLVREMYESKILLVGRHYGKTIENPEAMMDRMLLRWGMREETYKNKVAAFWKRVGDALEKPGKFSERIVKIAAYKSMKERGITGKELAHKTRVLAGSPDFYRRGKWFGFYNNVFLFSNAGKEGWRSSYEGFKNDPGKFTFRMAMFDLAPKLMMRAAQAGVLAAVFSAQGDDEESKKKADWAKWLQTAYEKIPERDKTNYMCIPVGETKSGKIAYMVMPHDFTGQVFGGLFWKLSKLDFSEVDLDAITDYINGGLPYSGLNPVLQMTIDLIQYRSGKNPYDPWRGRQMISETTWEAGGKYRAGEFLKQMWNRYGGNYVYRFPYDDLDRIRADVEKAVDAPGVGPGIKRFLRVSDRGLLDLDRIEAEKVRKERAREGIEVNQKIIEHLNKVKTPSRGDARELYNKLREKGVDVKEFHDFYMRYQSRTKLRENTALSMSLRSARSNQEKAAIYSRHLHARITEKDLDDAEKLTGLLIMKRRGKLSEKERRILESYTRTFK